MGGVGIVPLPPTPDLPDDTHVTPIIPDTGPMRLTPLSQLRPDDAHITAMLDSGAGVHTAPLDTRVLANRQPSLLKAKLADNTVVRAAHTGEIERVTGGTSATLRVHEIPGSDSWLLSLPLLLAEGHDFFLTNKGTSYEFVTSPTGTLPLPIGRSRHYPDGTASGYLLHHMVTSGGRVTHKDAPRDGGRSIRVLGRHMSALAPDTSPGHSDASPHSTGHAVSLAANRPSASELPHAGRFPALPGVGSTTEDRASLLHERLGHPSGARLRNWSQVALGFPSPSDPTSATLLSAAGDRRASCATCHAALDRRRPTPSKSPAGRSHRPGSAWSVDFTRTFPATPEGHTVGLVALERATKYVKVYLLKDHTDFWDAAQQLVDWCASTAGCEIREIQGDCDVVWASGSMHRPTAECTDFSVHNQIVFSLSPPHTQSMNAVEKYMEPLLGTMYALMAHARVGAPMWGDALLHAATIHNMGPMPGVSIPEDLSPDPGADDPRLPYSPQGAFLGTLPDISLLAAPLFATAWVLNPGAKASQLRPKSRMGIFVGVSQRTIGFDVRLLDDLSRVSSIHVRFDQDLTRRPAELAVRHDLLTGPDGASGPSILDTVDTLLSRSPLTAGDSLVAYDTFTKMPVALVPSYDAEHGATLLEVSHDASGTTSLPSGRRVRSLTADGLLRDGTIFSPHARGPESPTVQIRYDDGELDEVSEDKVNHDPPRHDTVQLLPTSAPGPDDPEALAEPAATGLPSNPCVGSSRPSRPPRHSLLARARRDPGPGGGRRVIGRDNAPMSAQRDRGEPNTLSYNMRRDIKRLPGATPIRFQQTNPKRGKSRDRYEAYKSATDVDTFLYLGGTRADLLNDYERGFVNLPHLDALHCLVAPTIALATTADLCQLQCTRDVTPVPGAPPFQPSSIRVALAADPLCHSIGTAGGTLCPLDDVPVEGVIPAIGACQQAWSDTKLSSSDPRWSCAIGSAMDASDALAIRLDALGSEFPSTATIERHMAQLAPPGSGSEMDRRIRELGHHDFLQQCPIDVLIEQAMEACPASLLASLTTGDGGATTEGKPPPPGRSPPEERQLGDPATFREMMADRDWDIEGGWRDKYLDEILQILDTYKAIEPSSLTEYASDRLKLRKEGKGRQAVIIPTTLVATRKFHADGTFHRLKVRLCAAQNKKRYDMGDNWSPTVGLDSVRFILTVAALTAAYVSTYDVSGAYLNGRRDKDDDLIYLRPPPGIDHLNESLRRRGKPADPRLRSRGDDGRTILFRCPGNLYGLQQAGKVWYLFARSWLLGPDMRLKQSNVDPCIFYRRFADGSFIIVALYVDDSLQVMSNATVCEWYASQFQKKFDQSPGSGGDNCDFLGMTIRQSPDRRVVHVNCPKLWMRLDDRLRGTKLPNARAPLPGNGMEEIYSEPSEENPILTEEECDVRGILGQVAWGVQACRPGEAFAAALLARRAHIPTRRYCKALIHFCAYCLQRRDDEIVIGHLSREKKFHCFVDSSWANDPSNNRSWFGYSLRWAGAAFCTRAKLQPVVALSSRDAEAIGAVYAVKAVLGFTIMLQELGFTPADPMRVMVDNKATVDGAHSDKVTKDSRHQAMRLAWLRDIVRSEIICLTHVTTGKNLADIHTKILAGPAHARLRAVLMGHGEHDE